MRREPRRSRQATIGHVADHIEHAAASPASTTSASARTSTATTGCPSGLEDVSGYPNLFAELIRRGWSDARPREARGRKHAAGHARRPRPSPPGSAAGRRARAPRRPRRRALPSHLAQGDTVQRIPRDLARKYAFDCARRAAAAGPARRKFRDRDVRRQHRLSSKRRKTRRFPASAPASTASRRWPTRSAGRSFSKEPSAATCSSSPSKTSWSTTTRGSRSGRAAGRWANRRAGPSCRRDYTTKIFRHTPGPSGTTRDGTLHFSDRISWPITPFIGTLGVAPDREVTTSLDGQGEWGGNLDIRDVAVGNRILLPVYHPGRALLPGRRARQPGRHRIHRHRRRDQVHRAAPARPDQGEEDPVDADRKAGSRSSRCSPRGRWKWRSKRRRST